MPLTLNTSALIYLSFIYYCNSCAQIKTKDPKSTEFVPKLAKKRWKHKWSVLDWSELTRPEIKTLSVWLRPVSQYLSLADPLGSHQREQIQVIMEVPFFRHWLDLSSKSERRLRTPDMNASSPSVYSNSQANLKGTRRHQRLWALGIHKCLAFLLEGRWRYAAQPRQKVNPFIESSLEGGIPTRSSSFHHKNKSYFVHRQFKRWRRVVGTPPGMFCQRLSAVTCSSDIIAPFFVTTRHPGFAHRTLGHSQVVRETGREPRTWWKGGLGGQADGSTQQ